MDRAPLPPHERPWRHPSEVGPTRRDVDVDVRGRTLVLAAGTLTAVLLIGMVVAMTPRPTNGPVAVSATTTPVGGLDDGRSDAVPRSIAAASFTAVPNAIAATPIVRQSAVEVAAVMPDLDDLVLVYTPDVTYRMKWADLAFLGLDGSALVLDADGRLVARLNGDDIVVLVED